MTINTLLKKLPSIIEIMGTSGYLALNYLGDGWCASYADGNGCDIRLNQDNTEENYVADFSEFPNEALKGLYDLCKKYKFIQ